METVLKIENLTKKFGSRTVIDNISFETYSGEIFGFLGPNGAGKTTTIKMIFGLLDMDGGEIFINGFNVRRQFEKAMSNIGGIVENPEMYNYLSGLQNLQQYRRMRDGVTDARIEEVIRIVGLENRIKDKVKKYSLGMKQRLGVAQAIMHNPKVLILDEPTNGLDPSGIKALRDIFKDLAHKHGVSVFVSSHLLSEMELMCDRVGIIADGRLIGVKTITELMESGSGKVYRFTVSSVEGAMQVLSSMEIPSDNILTANQQFFELKVDSDDVVTAVNAQLVTAGIGILGVAPIERSLEDIFIEITGGRGDQIG